MVDGWKYSGSGNCAKGLSLSYLTHSEYAGKSMEVINKFKCHWLTEQQQQQYRERDTDNLINLVFPTFLLVRSPSIPPSPFTSAARLAFRRPPCTRRRGRRCAINCTKRSLIFPQNNITEKAQGWWWWIHSKYYHVVLRIPHKYLIPHAFISLPACTVHVNYRCCCLLLTTQHTWRKKKNNSINTRLAWFGASSSLLSRN